jgi:hypothetical protein
MTPVSKPGVPDAGTYVVCLDCGKQFAYDLNEMRIGKPVPISPTAGVLDNNPPKANKKLRYAALASAVPVAWILSTLFKQSKKASGTNKSQQN